MTFEDFMFKHGWVVILCVMILVIILVVSATYYVLTEGLESVVMIIWRGKG